MSLKYAIVEWPIKEDLLKSGLIPQTNESARTNNSNDKCIVSFADSFNTMFRGYPTFISSDLVLYLNKRKEEWDIDLKIQDKRDSDGHAILRLTPMASTDGFFFRGQGFRGKADKSDGTIAKTTNIDYKISADRYINGIRLMLMNHSFSDDVNFEIVDRDFVFAGSLYPATPLEAGVPVPEGTPWEVVVPDGVMLNRFGESWQLSGDSDQGRELLKYPARLLAGMYVRIVYTTYSTSDVEVKCNLYLHDKQG